jgi:hypothetical protein
VWPPIPATIECAEKSGVLRWMKSGCSWKYRIQMRITGNEVLVTEEVRKSCPAQPPDVRPPPRLPEKRWEALIWWGEPPLVTSPSKTLICICNGAEWVTGDVAWPAGPMPAWKWVPYLREDLRRAEAEFDSCRRY